MEPTHTIDTDTLTPIVARVLKINDITTGDPKKNYLARYRGKLYGDSIASYDLLADNLRSLEITPLFREKKGQHEILLIQGTIKARPSNPYINLLLFILTLLSMIFAGAIFSYAGPTPEDPKELITAILQSLPSGVPFAASLLSILLAHEFGHYLAARYHNTQVTLPYFIPLPLSPFGTMGAAIMLKEPPKNKRILLDIGIAGPIAGMVIAIPVILFGLSISEIIPIEVTPGQGIQLEGNSVLYLLAKFLMF